MLLGLVFVSSWTVLGLDSKGLARSTCHLDKHWVLLLNWLLLYDSFVYITSRRVEQTNHLPVNLTCGATIPRDCGAFHYNLKSLVWFGPVIYVITSTLISNTQKPIIVLIKLLSTEIDVSLGPPTRRQNKIYLQMSGRII